jgi:ATP-dependent RNA helicase DDX52/ROK1
MEKTSLSSALFAGTRFDRKRFAGDIARFRKGGPPAPVQEAAPPPAPERKRKRKSKNNAKKKNKKKKRADGAPSGELSCLVSNG